MTTAPVTHLKHGYSSYQIALHWTVAALVLVNWLLGGGMAAVFHAYMDGEQPNLMGAAYVHVLIGLTVLLVMVARLAARLSRPVVTSPDSPHRLLAVLGTINHWAFYAMLFLIPISGAIAWFGGNENAAALHELAVTILLVLIGIHVAAALLHQLVLRDHLMRRMIRPV